MDIISNDYQKPTITPLNTRQMLMIMLVTFVEPIQFGMLFPFVYFMVKGFQIPDQDLGFHIGLLASSFCIAQLLTSLPWGFLSDRIGRRPVILIGLLGNAITCTLFGTSKSFMFALAMRSLCGLLNGNVGVVKSMLGEMTDSTNRGQAFSYWESAYGLGSIFGPVLGGLLVDPVRQFPAYFKGNLLFTEYPYLLPCMVSSVISVVGAIVGFVYMEETSPIVLKRLTKGSLQRDSTLLGITTRNRYSLTLEEEEPLLDGQEEDSIQIEQEISNSPVIHHPQLERLDSSISIQLPSLKEIITDRKVIWGILSYATWCLITIIYEEVYALYVSEPLLKGGLEFNSFEIGVILSFSGFVQFISQLLLYPRIERYFGLIGTFRLASLLMVIFATGLPFCTDYARYLVNLHGGGYNPDDKIKVYILLSILLAGKTLASVIGYIPVIIMVNDSAPTPGSLGTVHGCGQVAASLVRSLGPTLGGVMWSWSLTNIFPFDFHFTLFFVGMLSVISVGISFYIERVFPDAKGH